MRGTDRRTEPLVRVVVDLTDALKPLSDLNQPFVSMHVGNDSQGAHLEPGLLLQGTNLPSDVVAVVASMSRSAITSG